MASPATLESSTPVDIDQHDLHIEESMLKRKAAILEEFLRNDERGTTSLEDRCRLLRRKIDILEDELAVAGKFSNARSYLKEAPGSHFVAVTRDEFSEWLRNEACARSQVANNSSVTASSAQLGQGFHVFSASPHSKSHPRKTKAIVDLSSSTPKRPRTDTNEKPPCLRCKTPKKRCDSFEKCTHCPAQSFDSESDYWKVLGCFRGHLEDLTSIFCPGYSRATPRAIQYHQGGTDLINFVLTKSRVSETKRRRILHLMKTSDKFAKLDSTSWESVEARRVVSREAISLAEYGSDSAEVSSIDLEDYEAAWSVLQAVSMDPAYAKATTYNLFTLLALGKSFTKQQEPAWYIFKQSRILLRQSVELYLLERLCGQIASGDMSAPPFDPLRGPNTLVLVDLREDFESFLRKFETTCSGRGKLEGYTQLACFYALLVLSVIKSLLIDAHSIRAGYECLSSWQDSDAMKISSAFRVMVSAFCWSSKSDVVLQAESGRDAEWSQALQETRLMVRQELWDKQGLKGTKEFLLGLGSCFYADESYNGFFIQRFGLDILGTFSGRPATASFDISSTRPTDPGEGLGVASLVHAFPISEAHQNIPPLCGNYMEWLSEIRNKSDDLSQGDPALASAQGSSFVFVRGENYGTQSNGSRSRRRGALNKTSLANAREIRRIGACWNCWAMKVPCSEGTTCDRCRNKRGNSTYDRCNRGGFGKVFSEHFFPRFLISQFSDEAIQEYTNTHTLGLEGRDIDVEISLGGDTPITVRVSPFKPAPDGAAHITYLSRDGRGLGVESLPVGLAANHGFTENDFTNQLEVMIETRKTIINASPRHSSVLSKIVLDAVFQFHKSTELKHPAIEGGLLLCSAIYAASRPLLIEESSATSILEHLGRDKENEKLYSSRLLHRQMKSIVYMACKRLVNDFLMELEKLFRKRQRALWPICFAAMLLLCLAIEQVQTLADTYVQALKSSEPETLVALEDDPRKSCRNLEETVYEQMKLVFHAIFRTTKGDKDGLNPFGGEFNGGEEAGFDNAAMRMIEEIKEKVAKNVEILIERDQILDFELGPEDFAQRNCGRLVANFLRVSVLKPVS